MSKTSSYLYLKIVTRFSPSWPPFSFSMGPMDPRVENPGKNTAPASVKCYTFQISWNSVSYCTQGDQNWLIYDSGFDGNFLQPNLSKLLTKLFCDCLCRRKHKFLLKLSNRIQNLLKHHLPFSSVINSISKILPPPLMKRWSNFAQPVWFLKW